MSYWWDGGGGGGGDVGSSWFDGDTWAADFGASTGLDYAFWGDHIADLPGFGTEWGSLSQLAEMHYDQMVQTAFALANATEATRTAVEQALREGDTALAASILANNGNIGIQTADGRQLFGMDAINYLGAINPGLNLTNITTSNPALAGTIDRGTLATVTIREDGTIVSWTNNVWPFGVFHPASDPNGAGTPVLFTSPLEMNGSSNPANTVPFNPASQADRLQAATVFAQQAQQFRNEGKPDLAALAEQLSRFYQVTDAERATAIPGDLISRLPPGVYAVGPRSAADIELDSLRAVRASAVEAWSGILADPSNDPQMWENMNLYGTEYGSIYGNRYPGDTSIYGSFELTRPSQGGQNIAGAVSLLGTTLTWAATNNHMNQLAEWSAREQQLMQQISHERNYTVPPRPADVQSFINQFPGMTAEQQSTLQALSAAFWGGTP
jgi:hypothetical protein